MIQNAPIVNALSFDIEDWFHMVEIDAVSDPRKWGDLESLVERYTEWILDALNKHDVKATFFVLGWIAKRYPHLVERMAREGHELASHSFWHRKVYEMTSEEFRKDLRQSIDSIESAGGTKVLGFRAPSFSITPGTEWAFDVMREEGIAYDASLFPITRGHGGYPCPFEAHEFFDTPSGKPMLALPMSTLKFGPVRLGFSGGGYMRLFPGWLIRHGFRQLNRVGIPTVVYLHPRDFAPDCPRVKMPLRRRFKCYIGLHTTKDKLRMLLKQYQFDTCAKILGLEIPELAIQGDEAVCD